MEARHLVVRSLGRRKGSERPEPGVATFDVFARGIRLLRASRGCARNDSREHEEREDPRVAPHRSTLTETELLVPDVVCTRRLYRPASSGSGAASPRSGTRSGIMTRISVPSLDAGTLVIVASP